MGRTQRGNNNAYCQDNEISWLDWEQAATEQDLLQFTETLTGLRRDHPLFRRRRFFRGQPQTRAGELRRYRLADPGRAGDDRGGLGH